MVAMNIQLFCAIVVSSLSSGFQHGYHTGIMNIPEKMFKNWIRKCLTVGGKKENTPSETDVRMLWAACLSMFSAGGIAGGIMTGFFANKCGYKGSLMWNNLLVVIGVAFLALSQRVSSVVLFIIGRFVIGTNAGFNSGVCQMFLVDIGPVGIRGCVCGGYQLSVTIGIVVAQFSSSLLDNDMDIWPTVFIPPLILALIQLVCLPFIPESPKYLLIVQEDETEAEESLKWFNKSSNVASELKTLEEEDNIVKELRTVDFKRMFTDVTLRTPLVICIVIMVGQQFCGINAVSIYYSTSSFKEYGFSERAAINCTLGVGVVNVLITLFTLPLVDSWGRRSLLLMGFSGLSVVTVALTTTSLLGAGDKGLNMKYASLVLVFVFLICFAPGVGTIPWFITAELFYHTAKALAVSIAVTANWLSNFLIGLTFSELQHQIGPYTLLIFAILDIFFFTFTYMYLPETARRTSQEIIELYK